MLLQDAIIQGLRKPCKHEFNNFQLYKLEYKRLKQYSMNPVLEYAAIVSGRCKTVNIKRWIADCPICGKLWLASSAKKNLIKMILQMKKRFDEIEYKDAIRYNSNNK